MPTLKIALDPDRLARLRQSAELHHVSPEELARRCIEEFLSRPDEVFRRAADQVLKKNAALHRENGVTP